MTHRTRTYRRPRQDVLNGYMRREEVKTYVFHAALQTERATPEETQLFLATAPEEVHILLDAMLPPPSPAGLNEPPLWETTLVQAVAGLFLSYARKRPTHS